MGWSERRGGRAQPAVFPELGGRGTALPAGGAAAEAERAHGALRRAEAQAQALVEAARQQAAAQLQEGYREGQLQGRAEALAEARARLAQLLAALEAGAVRMKSLEQEFQDQAGEVILRLVRAVAGRILRTEAAGDPEAIRRVVCGALAELPAGGEVTVRLHPDQHALLEEQRGALQEARDDLLRLRLLADPALEPGGCLVEAPGCLVDARVATQLEEAIRRLRDGRP